MLSKLLALALLGVALAPLAPTRAFAAPVAGPPAPVAGPHAPVAGHPAPVAGPSAPIDTSGVETVGGEPYRLKADRLEGSMASGENVYTATHVTVIHGTTTVTGDSALIFRVKELVQFRGNVLIVDGTTHMWGREASYDRKSRIAVLHGDVRIEENGAVITGDEARFYRAENRSVVTGHPVLRDSTRTLSADRIEFDRDRNVVLATGHVDAYDSVQKTRVQASRVRYDRTANYAWAEVEPVLEMEEKSGTKTEVRGKTLEFDNARRSVYAIGGVKIRREALRATCDRAEFYQSEQRALLLGDPRAWDEEGVARGDTIEITFVDDRLESLRLRPHGIVEYTAKADSGRGERNVANGDTITVHFTDEQAREAVIVGHAESRYWPSSADSIHGGRNESQGDTIHVHFEKGKPTRATVRGGSRGVYYMAAEGDTSRLASEETVRYLGTEIVYDVDQGTVDVLGDADVTYKEMRLNADRVTFNSNTDRMRAEGAPILNDGKDRITGETMTYDLATRQGMVYEGRTNYERGFIYGEKVKKISENVLEVKHGTYSTCDLHETHYHFESAKMKVMLQDKVVARPVVFYIKHIPVLALPFYVFPIKAGRHSGFQLPQVEFGSATNGGKFVRNLGYYWAINDYMDATAWYDYYQEQSWVAHGQYRYHKRYGFQGQISTSFEDQFGTGGSTNWNLIGSHYQTLGTNFALTAQADLTNSSQFRRDPELGNNVLMRIQRNLRSNLSLQRGWSGGAFSLGLLQNEDLDAEPGGLKTQQQLPTFTYRINARPIGHIARGQEPAKLPWLSTTVVSFGTTGLYERKEYEPFYTQYAYDSLGVAVDSTRVDSLDARGAARYDFGLTDVRTLLGFIRVSPRFNYSGVYYSRDQSGAENQLGGVWSAGIGVNTAIFGTFHPQLGAAPRDPPRDHALRGVRVPAAEPEPPLSGRERDLPLAVRRGHGHQPLRRRGEDDQLRASKRYPRQVGRSGASKGPQQSDPPQQHGELQHPRAERGSEAAFRHLHIAPVSPDPAQQLRFRLSEQSVRWEIAELQRLDGDQLPGAEPLRGGGRGDPDGAGRGGGPRAQRAHAAGTHIHRSSLAGDRVHLLPEVARAGDRRRVHAVVLHRAAEREHRAEPLQELALRLPLAVRSAGRNDGVAVLHGEARASLLGNAVHPKHLRRRGERVLLQDQREESTGGVLRARLARAARVRRVPGALLDFPASSCEIHLTPIGARRNVTRHSKRKRR